MFQEYKARQKSGELLIPISREMLTDRLGPVEQFSRGEARQYVVPVVFGKMEDVRLLVVGRNPGRDEDAVGFPFVGPSGRVLFSWLDEIGIPIECVAITNLVPCYTREDREPTSNEVKAGAPFVFELMRSLPKLEVVLLCGTLVVRTFGIAEPVMQLVGKYFSTKQGLSIVPSIHPGAQAYQPSNRRHADKVISVLKMLLWKTR
jgi:DNA polymerase